LHAVLVGGAANLLTSSFSTKSKPTLPVQTLVVCFRRLAHFLSRTGDFMTWSKLNSGRLSSVRKYFYAALMALSTLNFAPTTAAQTSMRGKFTLPHDVHWENAIVPAGDYQFSLDSDAIEVLRLDELSGAHAGFTFVVHEEAADERKEVSRIMLETTSAGSYVTSMQLPAYGRALNFNVPASIAKKQIARAATPPPASGQ
jgi:hypothetical protein